MDDNYVGDTTPGWLKSTPRAAPTTRSPMRALGDLSSAAANKSCESTTPQWLKQAAREANVEENAASPAVTRSKARNTHTTPIPANGSASSSVAFVTKGELKIGAVKIQCGATLASLRKDLLKELKGELKMQFPKGWRFALPEGVPVMRAQERTWLGDDVASRIDGRPHLALVEDACGTDSSMPAMLSDGLRKLSVHALCVASAGAELRKKLRAMDKRLSQKCSYAPLTRLISSCAGPTLIARGGATSLRSFGEMPVTPRLSTQLASSSTSTRTPVMPEVLVE